MYQAHELLGVFAVLFSIAEKDIRVEGGPDLIGQIIRDQYIGKKTLQLLIKSRAVGSSVYLFKI